MSISATLRRAARLQEKIDRLREQLAAALDQARAEVSTVAREEMASVARLRGRAGRARHPVDSAPRRPRGAGTAATARLERRSPLAGKKRAASPSGPLAPAVVKVLQARRAALSVRDILDGLLSAGYQFNAAEPRKNLAARIYRLKGVKQVAPGLFGPG